MRYLIDGCYGDGNVGDEALLQAACQILRRHDPDADIRAFSADPSATERLHGIPAIQQTNPFGVTLYGALFKGELAATTRAIRWADCFVLGGGELFRDDVGLRAALGIFYRSLLASATGTRLVALGVGVRRPSTRLGLRLFRQVVRRADALVVRDPESYAVCRDQLRGDSRVHCRSDIVLTEVERFAREPAGAVADDSGRIRVCVSLKALPDRHPFRASFSAETLVTMVADAVVSLQGRYALAVDALAFAPEDVALAQRLGVALAAAGVPVVIDDTCAVGRLAAATASAGLALAMPLHASVFSFGLGVPAVGIAYDRKVDRLFSQFGLERLCVGPSELSAERLARACADVLESSAALREGIRQHVRAERASFDELAEVIFGPTRRASVTPGHTTVRGTGEQAR